MIKGWDRDTKDADLMDGIVHGDVDQPVTVKLFIDHLGRKQYPPMATSEFESIMQDEFWTPYAKSQMYSQDQVKKILRKKDSQSDPV